ncbi:hypothetical protein BDV93DRAFT_518696 [Ceratobasidium sp. AG-I]|nr:hypothetical protein BDV93DRAFT_518696 [Ceratobasidium sp. AG-I]
MPIKAHKSPQKNIRSRYNPETTSPTLAQHGSPNSRLLQLPSELLTHLTAYLDPVALAVLASVCRTLAAHVGQDNTWRCAFLCHFLGVSPDPDSSLSHPKLVVLRRGESSWRAEFQKRWIMAKRWERGKAPTVTHRPHRTPLSAVHVLQTGKNTQGVPIQPANCALLSASLATGSVMRSYPFNGKIVRGHFDASSTTTALGLGLNPNFQEAFSNVSAIALASTGGTGLVIWGLQSGGVAVTVAPRAMDAGCSARMIKCKLPDAHRTRVEEVYVDNGPNGAEYFVSGASDGSVKLWTLPASQRGQVNCVWTGEYSNGGDLASDVAAVIKVPCVKVAVSIQTEVVAAGYADGTVLVWFSVSPSSSAEDPSDVKCVRVPPPSLQSSAPTTLRIHVHSRTSISVLVHHSTDDHFYRLRIEKDAGFIKRTRFGGGPLGALGAILTEFVKQEKEDARTTQTSAVGTPADLSPTGPSTRTPTPASLSVLSTPVHTPLRVELTRPEIGSAPVMRSFIAAGDALGSVCVWDWDEEREVIRAGTEVGKEEGGNGSSVVPEVQAALMWDALDGEGVTSLVWSDVVVAVGGANGHTSIFDSLTQRLLRRIPSPSPASAQDSVSQLVVEGDLLLVGVGGQIVAWHARKEVGNGNAWAKGGAKGKKTAGGKSNGVVAKWQRERNELNTEISHSLTQLKDESARSKPGLRRARAQAGALAEMGMDEGDAVQYLMMLSRDEEDARRAAELPNSHEVEEQGQKTNSEAGSSGTEETGRVEVYGSPTNSTRSSVPSASTSPSSRRSGRSVYIPANGRPRTNLEIPDANPYMSRSYGSAGGSHGSGSGPHNGGGDGAFDEDEELRLVLEMSLLDQ